MGVSGVNVAALLQRMDLIVPDTTHTSHHVLSALPMVCQG